MRVLMLLVVMALGLCFWSSVGAAQWCGLPPLPAMPQVGCVRMQPVCTCDAEGNCQWIFVCVRVGS